MENVVEVSIIMGISKRKKYQGRVGGRVGVTYSATRAPFLVTVLASTTNTTAFADCKCSLNVTRIRGYPGISTIFNCRFDSDVTSTDEFAWRDVCVGRVWLYISFVFVNVSV